MYLIARNMALRKIDELLLWLYQHLLTTPEIHTMPNDEMISECPKRKNLPFSPNARAIHKFRPFIKWEYPSLATALEFRNTQQILEESLWRKLEKLVLRAHGKPCDNSVPNKAI